MRGSITISLTSTDEKGNDRRPNKTLYFEARGNDCLRAQEAVIALDRLIKKLIEDEGDELEGFHVCKPEVLK